MRLPAQFCTCNVVRALVREKLESLDYHAELTTITARDGRTDGQTAGVAISVSRFVPLCCADAP